MKQSVLSYLFTVLGIALAAGGIIILKFVSEAQGVFLELPYVMIVLGCGLFGHGTGELVNKATMKKHPDLALQDEINKTDERNIAIANRGKAKAYDAMLFIFGALMLSLALLNVDLIVILLLVFAYMCVVGIGLYYRFKYEKEM